MLIFAAVLLSQVQTNMVYRSQIKQDLKIPEIRSRKQPMEEGDYLDVWGLEAKLESLGYDVQFAPKKKRGSLLKDYSVKVESAVLDIDFHKFQITLFFFISERFNVQTQTCYIKSSLFSDTIDLSDWSSNSIIAMLTELPSIIIRAEEAENEAEIESREEEKAQQKEDKLQTMKDIAARAIVGKELNGSNLLYEISNEGDRRYLVLHLLLQRTLKAPLTDKQVGALDSRLRLVLSSFVECDQAFDGLFMIDPRFFRFDFDGIDKVKMFRSEWLKWEEKQQQIQAYLEDELNCHQYEWKPGLNTDLLTLQIAHRVLYLFLDRNRLDTQLKAMNTLVTSVKQLAKLLPDFSMESEVI